MVKKKKSPNNSKIKDKIKSKGKDKISKNNTKGDGTERVHVGVPGFEALIAGGIPHGYAVLVEGGPGSGKTIFCLQSMFNLCKQGKKVLYMSFEEPEDRLMSHMKSFGWDIEPFVKKGSLKIKRFDALDIARSVEALLSAAKKELLIDVEPMFFPEDFEPEIVMVDSLTSIASAFSGEENRFRIYMEQLFRYLEAKKITSFLIREVPIPTHMGNVMGGRSDEAVSFLSDGIIAIYNVIHDNGKRESGIEVIKMRGTHINKKIVNMTITDKGLTIYPGKGLDGVHTKVKLT